MPCELGRVRLTDRGSPRADPGQPVELTGGAVDACPVGGERVGEERGERPADEPADVDRRGAGGGWEVVGEAMQTAMWADFISAVAATIGEGVRGEIRAETRRIDEEPDAATYGPTYLAKGD